MRDHIGKNLRRCRERTGLSQEELGIRASLHRTEIGLLERGERLPRVDTLVKLASVLAVSPCDLLAGITWEPGYRRSGEYKLSDRSGSARRG